MPAMAAPPATPPLGAPAREIVVELKDAPSNTVPNTTGLPPAFPRPGSKNDAGERQGAGVELCLGAGQAHRMHFHNTEVVVAYRGDGDVASTTPDGKTTVSHRSHRRHRLQSRQPQPFRGSWSRASSRGIMLELK